MSHTPLPEKPLSFDDIMRQNAELRDIIASLEARLARVRSLAFTAFRVAAKLED